MKNISYLFILSLFVCVSCTKEEQLQDAPSNFQNATTKQKLENVDLCHFAKSENTWEVINVNENSLNAHLNHGDVVLIDADDDGFVEALNECVPGGDCDDSDPTIYPGAIEICGDGIDQDCDGQDLSCDCPCYTYEDLDLIEWKPYEQLGWGPTLMVKNFPITAYVTAGYNFTDVIGGLNEASLVDLEDGFPNWTAATKLECGNLALGQIENCQELIVQKWIELTGYDPRSDIGKRSEISAKGLNIEYPNEKEGFEIILKK